MARTLIDTATIAWGESVADQLMANLIASPFIVSLLGDADASTARASLGVTIGSNVQAWDADLDAIAALTKTDGNFIVGNGTTWVAENGATARASMGAIGGSTGATDNRLLRSDGTGGVTVQNSAISVDDNGAMSGLDDVTQTRPGGMWTTIAPFVNISRLDRLFVGAADTCTGNFDLDNQGGIVPTDSDGPSYLSIHASILSMAPYGGYAIIGSSMASMQNGTASSIGVGGATINDGASDRLCWSLYSDVQHETGYASYGLEAAIKNAGTNYDHAPYGLSTDARGAFGVWMQGGGDNSYGPVAANPTTAGIAIVQGSHTWNKGILFECDALTGCNGVTGTGVAMAMARGHQINWYYAGDNFGAGIVSLVDASASSTLQVFDDRTVYWQSSTGKNIFQMIYAANAVNFLQVESRIAGLSARLLAAGDDTDIDIQIVPKGAGALVTASGVAAALRANLFSTTVNFNSANTDHAIAIRLPQGMTRYRVSNVVISGASAVLNTATWGLFTATAGGGTALVAAGTATGISSAAENTNGNMSTTSIVNVNSLSLTATTLYFRVGTAQGSAATGTVTLNLNPVS